MAPLAIKNKQTLSELNNREEQTRKNGSSWPAGQWFVYIPLLSVYVAFQACIDRVHPELGYIAGLPIVNAVVGTDAGVTYVRIYKSAREIGADLNKPVSGANLVPGNKFAAGRSIPSPIAETTPCITSRFRTTKQSECWQN